MFNPIFAMISSFIWAFSPIYYKTFMKRFDFLLLNLLRTGIASVTLALPAFYFGFNDGAYYALISGSITLAVGDTLYLLAVREMGASIASPVVYIYVLFVQVTAGTVGEFVPYANYAAAVMVVAGVFVLSRGGDPGKPRAKGIAYGLAAGLTWAVGQAFISLATGTGASVVSITFARNLAAALALGLAVLATRRWKLWPTKVTGRELGIVAAIALSDLAVGSLLFVYSVSLVGVAVTVILTSLSPLLTQIFSKLLGKESPSGKDLVGGAIIVAAVVLAVAL